MSAVAKGNSAFQFGAFQASAFQMYVPIPVAVSGSGGNEQQSTTNQHLALIKHNNDVIVLFAQAFMERQRWEV